MSVSEAAEQYFSNINPIASRIYADFEETKSSYDCIWKSLSSKEQSQILNECIIKPEVSLQYNLKSVAKNNENGDIYSRKRVIDENVSYRDEHSAPWSFKTLSQINLNLFSDEKNENEFVAAKMEPAKTQPQSPPPTTPQQSSSSSATNILTKLFSRNSSGVGIKDFLGTSEEYQILVSSPQSNSTSETGTTLVDITPGTSTDLLEEGNLGYMPKTGLDFLDNW